MATTTLTYLIPRLRLLLGDTDPESYRYLVVGLEIALVASVSDLETWWDYKYKIDSSVNEVERNSLKAKRFVYQEPPVIQTSDEGTIVLMAAIIILRGSLENSSWNFGAWRDSEVSYSNIEGGRSKRNNLEKLWEMLTMEISPPGKVLAGAEKAHLPGYKGNIYEE